MDAARLGELRFTRPLAICLVLGGIISLAYALVLALGEIPYMERSYREGIGIKQLPEMTEAAVACAWVLPVVSAVPLAGAAWALIRPRRNLLLAALLMLIAAWALNAVAAFSLTLPFRSITWRLTNE